MNIIFQSGEFYNTTNSFWPYLISVISALLGALITGGIAIYIFNNGLKKEKEKKRNEIIIEYNNLEQYFFHSVESIMFFIEKQVDEVLKCSRNTKDWNKSNFWLSIFPELTTRNIWDINQEKLYDIFVSNSDNEIKLRVADFINLRICLYNIDNFVNTQKELNSEIHERLFLNIELWNQSLKTLLNLSNSFVLEHNLKPIKDKDDFLKFYTDLMVKRQRNLIENNVIDNIEINFKELIEPLKKYLKDNPQFHDERVYKVSDTLMNIQKAYSEIKYLRYEYRKNVLRSGQKLIQVKALMSLCISNIKKRKKIYK